MSLCNKISYTRMPLTKLALISLSQMGCYLQRATSENFHSLNATCSVETTLAVFECAQIAYGVLAMVEKDIIYAVWDGQLNIKLQPIWMSKFYLIETLQGGDTIRLEFMADKKIYRRRKVLAETRGASSKNYSEYSVTKISARAASLLWYPMSPKEQRITFEFNEQWAYPPCVIAWNSNDLFKCNLFVICLPFLFISFYYIFYFFLFLMKTISRFRIAEKILRYNYF